MVFDKGRQVWDKPGNHDAKKQLVRDAVDRAGLLHKLSADLVRLK